MFEKKPAWALILSGGGAKGAYEIGVWRALRELNIRINAVCGTSVGALNAAIIAQDDYEIGVNLWSEMTIDKVVDIPEAMLRNGKPDFSLRSMMKIGDLHLNIKNLGLDPSPLYNLLKAEIDEDRIRRSGIDLGIVTVKIGNIKPCEIFLDDMPFGTLPDYLLASASFPAFKRAEINGKQFADGAIWDNIPHAMMKNRGYRRLIVVDIAGLGANKRPDITGTNTVYIKTSADLGSVLDFNPDKAVRAMEVAYLDTMKVYEKNEGQKYFITPDAGTEKRILAQLLKSENIEKYKDFLKLDGRRALPDNVEALIREVLPRDQRSHRNLILCLIEAAASVLNVERIKLYRTDELLEAVREKYTEVQQSGMLPSRTESESFFKMVEGAIESTLKIFKSDKELGDYSPYEYAKMLRNPQAAEKLIPEMAAAEILLSLF